MIKSFADRLIAQIIRAEEWLFANPKIVLGMIMLVTLGFAAAIPQLKVYSDFSDLLPQNHPYIKTYNQLKENFGGANMVVMAVEVKEGTIFNNDTLKLIEKATQGVDNLPSVNHNLVSSLTHRSSRKIYLDETGAFLSDTFYDSNNGELSDTQLKQLQKDVTANPTIYGLLVSPDMKAALIKAQLNEGDIDYEKTFGALM